MKSLSCIRTQSYELIWIYYSILTNTQAYYFFVELSNIVFLFKERTPVLSLEPFGKIIKLFEFDRKNPSILSYWIIHVDQVSLACGFHLGDVETRFKFKS